METIHDSIRERFRNIAPYLNEKFKRIWAANEANAIGHGGIKIVARATGLAKNTIRGGLKEITGPPQPEELGVGRLRKPGGGRKRAVDKYPNVSKVLDEIMEPATRGDPESPLLWSSKSLRKLAIELSDLGYKISYRVVGEVLKSNGYSLQANKKTYEGKGHPDRDLQFQHIHSQLTNFHNAEEPVISVDTKKKELVGNFKNAGREWTPAGKPEEVFVYDFPSLSGGKAIPYGVYDTKHNQGWVSVGTNHDTAEFAVATIRRWWKSMGSPLFQNATKLLITADGGGSNGSRVRLWKTELQKFADEANLSIHVSHFPPGTSKWNKIEHKLFSYITKNWRGKPLTCYETIVNLISATTTEKGLSVRCELDTHEYLKGIKATDAEIKQLNIKRDPFHGEWNYVICPKKDHVIS